MPTLTIGRTEIAYDVRYSERAQRKRISVTPGGVEVVAPEGTPWDGRGGVREYVTERRRWVFDSVREVAEKHRKLLVQRYASGAKLQYRGRWLMLDVRTGPVEEVEIACRSRFHVVVPEARGEEVPEACGEDGEDAGGLARLEAVRAAFDAWLRDRAQRDLGRFAREHERRLGLPPGEHRLSDSKSRWGSCGRDGVVRVHWRLIQAPRVAFEYVVAHELVHRVERNHSPAFWARLAETMPDWADGKAALERWEEGHRAV